MKNLKVSSMTSIITDIFTLWLICIITKYDLSERGNSLAVKAPATKAMPQTPDSEGGDRIPQRELTNKTSIYQPAVGLTWISSQ